MLPTDGGVLIILPGNVVFFHVASRIPANAIVSAAPGGLHNTNHRCAQPQRTTTWASTFMKQAGTPGYPRTLSYEDLKNDSTLDRLAAVGGKID